MGATARVLLAEDDDALRDLISLRLVKGGHVVHAVGSGHDLLAAVLAIREEHSPLEGIDLIVLDNHMPGITGLETIRALRAACHAGPVLLITAFPSVEVIADAGDLNAHVLAKPFALDRLESEVAHALTPE